MTPTNAEIEKLDRAYRKSIEESPVLVPLLVKALLKARSEFPPIYKDATNPHFRSKFASLDAILSAVVPILAKHGLLISQPIRGCAIETTIHHEGGEFITSAYPLPEALVAEPQKFGAAVTYGRRYSLSAILGIVADEDDDAESTTTHARGPQNAQEAPGRAQEGKADPKAHHSPERRKAAAALYSGLEKAFGDTKPWEGGKMRVLKEIFGKDSLSAINKMSNEEFLQLYNDNFAAVLEAAIKESQPKDPNDVPF